MVVQRACQVHVDARVAKLGVCRVAESLRRVCRSVLLGVDSSTNRLAVGSGFLQPATQFLRPDTATMVSVSVCLSCLVCLLMMVFMVWY